MEQLEQITLEKAANQWCITREHVLPDAPTDLEDAVFSLSNGYIGVRGSRPFCARGTAGTFVNGLYAEGPTEMTYIPPVGHLARDGRDWPSEDAIAAHGLHWVFSAAPNVFAISGVDGQGIAAEALAPTLDLRHGTLYFDGDIIVDGARWHWHSVRFVSKSDRSLIVERIELTPADPASTLTLCLGLDDSVAHRHRQRIYDLWEAKDYSAPDAQSVLWHGVTAGKRMELAMALVCSVQGGAVAIAQQDQQYALVVRGSGAMTIERYVGIASSVFDSDIAAQALAIAQQAAQAGFADAYASHCAALAALWDACDIEIGGVLRDQQLVRFSVFHLACSAVATDQVSIGAKFLSHQGYSGGVFWDMDVYIMPFLIKTLPALARKHVDFRYRGLAAARKKALSMGYQGAMFPCTAVPSGEDAIEPWIIFNRSELHFISDVAWGIMEYYRWSGDEAFMQTEGWEILADTARFWMSRIDHATGSINEVCGPDECNSCVNNSAFVNLIVRKNLLWAYDYCAEQVPLEERDAWQRAAGALVQHLPDANGLIEQFDGYYAPPPKHLAKQADILAIPQLFPDELTTEQIRVNYEYYEPRTEHTSSLSEGAYATSAARIGQSEEAYRMFLRAAQMDLYNLHHDTTGGGLHAACMGSVTTAVMQGFCGLTLRDQALHLTAQFPAGWEYVAFKVCCKGKQYRVKLRNGESETIELG
jgi:trehalose/maltose hydrolase-like predicted phosphorylase